MKRKLTSSKESEPVAIPADNDGSKPSSETKSNTTLTETSEAIRKEKREKRKQLGLHLSEHYPVWANQQPLAIGAGKDIIAIAKTLGISGIIARKVIRFHTTRPKYHQILLESEQRFHLDGTPAQTISEENRKNARKSLMKIEQRRQERAEKKKQKEQQTNSSSQSKKP
ncbi:MAG: ProQ/FINO family protein [Endozoicomonas sp.]